MKTFEHYPEDAENLDELEDEENLEECEQFHEPQGAWLDIPFSAETTVFVNITAKLLSVMNEKFPGITGVGVRVTNAAGLTEEYKISPWVAGSSISFPMPYAQDVALTPIYPDL